MASLKDVKVEGHLPGQLSWLHTQTDYVRYLAQGTQRLCNAASQVMYPSCNMSLTVLLGSNGWFHGVTPPPFVCTPSAAIDSSDTLRPGKASAGWASPDHSYWGERKAANPQAGPTKRGCGCTWLGAAKRHAYLTQRCVHLTQPHNT